MIFFIYMIIDVFKLLYFYIFISIKMYFNLNNDFNLNIKKKRFNQNKDSYVSCQ